MALQATTLHPSAFSVPKEGKPSTSIKEYSLFGVSLSDHAKSDFSSFALKCKAPPPSGLGLATAKALAETGKMAHNHGM